MSPHSTPVCSELSVLRKRRDALCRKAMYRHRCPDVLAELQAVTCEILKRELEDRACPPARPARPGPIEPLGDAGAAGGYRQSSLPYKD